MLTESKWEKRKQFHNIIENVIYFKIPNYHCSPPLKLQLLSSFSPKNNNCSPSAPLPIHNCSPSLPPLPNYNCSPSPPCLGTSFVSKHCVHDFTVWANHIHRLNSWNWKIEVITFASTCCFSFLSFLSSEICQLFVLEFKKFGDLHFCQM